jgi:hypothetical protein
MHVVQVFCLTTIGLAVLMEPAFAGQLPSPGPIAGIGLPAVALIGGAYWVGRNLFAGKK